MTTRQWIFLNNTFYSQTVESIKNALSLTVDHVAKLTANEADADILSIKTNYSPIHTAFVTVYNQLQSKQGLYKGKTQTFEELMEELKKEKINEWRGQVFAVFPEGNADATAIFPRGRKPFQQGTYEQEIEAVETLAQTLSTYTGKPTLITLGIAVEAHHTVLLGARALQQTDEGSTAALRTALKTAHVLLCNGLYRNLGLLMAKYAETPLAIANYFDLSLLRDITDMIEITAEVDAAPNAIVNFDLTELGINFEKVVDIKFESVHSDGQFYAGETETSPPGATSVNVPADESAERSAEDAQTQLGANETHTKINVKNTGTVAGHYKITFTIKD